VYGYVTDEAPPPKALADTFEALMAAVYIDCNFDMSVICKLFWPLLEVRVYMKCMHNSCYYTTLSETDTTHSDDHM
jgi:dsRNA-specific ribonuclease